MGEMSGIVLELQRLHATASSQIEQLAGERDAQHDTHTRQLSDLQSR